jgi:hypothetical protein
VNALDPGVTGRKHETGPGTPHGKTGGADDGGPFLTTRMICARYSIVGRTLDRWLATGALEFPRPIYVNRRRYFRERQLQDWERARAAASKAA